MDRRLGELHPFSSVDSEEPLMTEMQVTERSGVCARVELGEETETPAPYPGYPPIIWGFVSEWHLGCDPALVQFVSRLPVNGWPSDFDSWGGSLEGLHPDVLLEKRWIEPKDLPDLDEPSAEYVSFRVSILTLELSHLFQPASMRDREQLAQAFIRGLSGSSIPGVMSGGEAPRRKVRILLYED